MQYDKLSTILTLCTQLGVNLRQVRDRYTACCPIHQEKTPSFWIKPDGYYRCYGCGSSGDAIDLWIAINGGDMVDAKKALGLWDEKRPEPRKVTKRLPPRFETTNKKYAWAYITKSLIQIKDEHVIVWKGKEYTALDFWLSKIRALPDDEFQRQVLNVTRRMKSEIGRELFLNEIERRVQEMNDEEG